MSGRTYVLVHGAFHGGWCWRPVAQRLRDLGHVVYTPTLTGLGERSHLLLRAAPTMKTFIEDILQVFGYEELRDVILVGHSFGGSTISGVADLVPDRLRHLVYFDALVLEPGTAALDSSPREHIERYRREARPSPIGPLSQPREPEYFGITDPEMAARLATMLTPQPFALYEERLDLANPVGNGVPATYIACTSPYLSSTARSRDLARARTDWHYVEMDAPHNAMMTHPDALATLLDSIASTRRGPDPG